MTYDAHGAAMAAFLGLPADGNEALIRVRRQVMQACVEMELAAQLLGRGRNKAHAEALRTRATKLREMVRES